MRGKLSLPAILADDESSKLNEVQIQFIVSLYLLELDLGTTSVLKSLLIPSVAQARGVFAY